MGNSVYNGVLILAMLLNLVCVYVADTVDDYNLLRYKIFEELPTIILSLIFTIDCLANFRVLGMKEVWNQRRFMYFELIISFAFWTAFILDVFIFTERTINARFTRVNAISSLRIFRIFELLQELTDFKFIVVTT